MASATLHTSSARLQNRREMTTLPHNSDIIKNSVAVQLTATLTKQLRVGGEPITQHSSWSCRRGGSPCHQRLSLLHIPPHAPHLSESGMLAVHSAILSVGCNQSALGSRNAAAQPGNAGPWTPDQPTDSPNLDLLTANVTTSRQEARMPAVP